MPPARRGTGRDPRSTPRLHLPCGGADSVEHEPGVGEHGHVATVDLVDGGVHALGSEALELGLDGAVGVSDDVPARLGPPGSAFNPQGCAVASCAAFGGRTSTWAGHSGGRRLTKVMTGAPKAKAGSRAVALDEGTVAALTAWRKQQAVERLAAGPAWVDHGLVFIDELGAPPHPETVTC
jgi:hypothetical protein